LFTLLIIIHILICIALIMVVLLQSSKGEGLAGAFGGSGLTSAVFGGRGAATFLSKATTYLAILFMISCLGLTFVSPATSGTSQESAVRKELGQNTGGQPMGEPTGVPPSDIQQGTQPIVVPPSGSQQGTAEIAGKTPEEKAANQKRMQEEIKKKFNLGETPNSKVQGTQKITPKQPPPSGGGGGGK